MRNLSFIMFGIALVLGTITVIFARNIINNQRATQVVQTTAPEEEMGTMVVAALPLKFGDEITVESLKVVPWPKDPDVRPEGSFPAISEIMTSDRRVAIRSMAKNEPVVQGKISGFGYRATLSQVVDPDKRAMAIRINDVSGVGGFVLPGDRVDVMHTFRNGKDMLDSETNMIIRDVRVLAMDQSADENSDGALVAKAATLEVSQEQATILSLAVQVGSLDLVLRPMNAENEVLDNVAKTVIVSDLRPDNSLSMPEEVKPKPAKRVYKPAKPKPVPVEAINPYGNMLVTRGVESETTEVLNEGIASAVIARSDVVKKEISELVGAYPGP